MATVQIVSEVKIEFEKLLDGVSKLETADLEQLLEEVSVLLARRKAQSLSGPEEELLSQINEPLPPAIAERYEMLRARLRDGIITEPEQQELLELVDVVEAADAKRLENLLELAHIRNLPLATVLTQLGIQTPPVHG